MNGAGRRSLGKSWGCSLIGKEEEEVVGMGMGVGRAGSARARWGAVDLGHSVG